MKQKKYLFTMLLSTAVLLSMIHSAYAQVQSISRIVSYQGQIKAENNLPVSGNHRVSVAFYSNTEGTDMIWKGEYETLTENGIFNILLGSGAYPLPEKLDRTIYVGVSIDGGKELRPLSVMAGVPYALTVPDKSITKEKLDVSYLGGISLDGKPITKKGSTLNLKSGLGMSLLYDEQTSSLSLNSLIGMGNANPQSILSDPCSGSNVDGGFISFPSTNVVGGGCYNIANPIPTAPYTGYASILGGYSNDALGPYSSIGGGYQNKIDTVGHYSAIGGGINNYIYQSHSFVGGGIGDTVLGQSAVVTGGENNRTSSTKSFIGGGDLNKIDASSYNSVIVGGTTNSIVTSTSAFIGGGALNSNHGPGSSIVGGGNNTLTAYASIIGGGDSNTIDVDYYATLSGGRKNRIATSTASANYGTIAGGRENTIIGTNSLSTVTYSGDYSVISGGRSNGINGDYSAIAGGRNLTLGTRSFGFNAGRSAIDVSADTNLAFFGDVDVLLENSDNKARRLKFFEPDSSGANSTSFRAQAQAFNINYVLPSVQGGVNTVLANNGNDTLYWGDVTTLVGDLGADAWKITGNSNADPLTHNFLGTNNNKAFEIHVFDSDAVNKGSKRVMRFWPNATSANIIGGYQTNLIPDTVVGSIIAGGGSFRDSNSIFEDFSAILGGKDNTIKKQASVIAGGDSNSIGTATGVSSDLGGVDQGQFSSVVGGKFNEIHADLSVIGGGGGFDTNGISQPNVINLFAHNSFIGGGSGNVIDPPTIITGTNPVTPNQNKNEHSVIVGGFQNIIHADPINITNGDEHETPKAGFTAIVGGIRNEASERASFIGGGEENQALEEHSVIGGGQGNIAGAPFTTIAGGEGNTCGPGSLDSNADIDGPLNGEHSFIGGGLMNGTSGSKAVICGGFNNAAAGFASFVGGGGGSQLPGSSLDSLDPVDAFNLLPIPNRPGISINTLHDRNFADGDFSVVTGGRANHVMTGFSFIGGGSRNIIHVSENLMASEENDSLLKHNIIGGGENNVIMLGTNEDVNHSSILGGNTNTIKASNASIGGGQNNFITEDGVMASIPGGDSLNAFSYGQTVVGALNKNTSITAATQADFKGNILMASASKANGRLFMVGNGSSPSQRRNAFEVSNNGHSIVYDNLGRNLDTGTVNISTRANIKGATFTDNIPIAWGRVGATGTLIDGFGVNSVTYNPLSPGTYTIKLDYIDPYTGSQVQISHGSSVVATITDDGSGGYCSFINTTPVTFTSPRNQFVVRTFINTITATFHQLDNTITVTKDCIEEAKSFMFVVYGRP